MEDFFEVRLYGAGTGMEKDKIAEALSVSLRAVASYVEDVDKENKRQRDEKIRDMWMRGHSQQDIADEVEVDQKTASRKSEELGILENLQKSLKVSALHEDEHFTPPIYNI